MRRYIHQLLEDIKNAHRPRDQKKSEPTFEEEMEAVENWAQGRGQIPQSLSVQCGLSIEQFPPVERLSEEDIELIMDAFQEMVSTWNLAVDFPENLPLARAYPLLINILSREAWYLPGGTLHFDFCTGNAPDCELKEYCPCLEYLKESSNKE